MQPRADSPRKTKPRRPHPHKALSAAFCRSVAQPGRYCDGNGLYLHVEPSGIRHWVQRLVIHGKGCALGLGSFALVPLAEARERALANRRVARAERVSLARRLGRAAVAVWRRSTAAIRKLLRRPPPDVDLEADRRRLDADLAAARRRTEQTRERLTKAVRETERRYDQAYADWSFQREWLYSRSSREERRKVYAAGEAADAAYATYKRARDRLYRYERAVDALERPRRASRAPYSPSLAQVVAEADRRLAQERQSDSRREHPRPRSDQPSPARVAETAPARPPASPSASRQRRPPPKPPSRTERPRTGPAIDVPDGVFPDNPETPPARAGSTRTDAPAPTWQHGR